MTNFAELDFNLIKQNLKNFLKGQEEYLDYNFEGSGLSYLLDILSLNTMYTNYYIHMAGNEAFLDSAVFRNSVVSRAKALGYLPQSRRSASAVISVELFPDSPQSVITIPKYTRFNTVIDGTGYVFQTLEAYQVEPDENERYLLEDIRIYEGVHLTHTFTVDGTVRAKYVLPNANVDTSTIAVKVQQSATNSIITVFTKFQDINLLNGTSTVFFISELNDGLHEVYFGDGIIGKKVVNGNLVIVDYLISNGPIVNKASSFELIDELTEYDGDIVVVKCSSPAFGGQDAESIESIRLKAPLNYETQARAVTHNDYETLIKSDFPNIEAVRVWGGQDNVPPQYGKVFVSIKPVDGFILSEDDKLSLINTVIKQRAIASIESVIVDPQYISLVINSTVKFKSMLTAKSPGEIKALVIQTIKNYALEQLNHFDSYFRFSKFTRTLDDCDPSIQNNLTTLRLKMEFEPFLFIPNQYSLEFSNAIDKGDVANLQPTLSSSPFTFQNLTCFFSDDGNGSLYIYRVVDLKRVIVQKNVGSINYDTGSVLINSFAPEGLPAGTDAIQIFVTPKTNDIVSQRNQIIVIENANINVTVLDETIGQVI